MAMGEARAIQCSAPVCLLVARDGHGDLVACHQPFDIPVEREPVGELPPQVRERTFNEMATRLGE